MFSWSAELVFDMNYRIFYVCICVIFVCVLLYTPFLSFCCEWYLKKFLCVIFVCILLYTLFLSFLLWMILKKVFMCDFCVYSVSVFLLWMILKKVFMVVLTVCGTQVSLIPNYCKTQQDLDMVLVIFIKEKILSALSCGCNINHSTNRVQHRLS